MTVYTRKPVPAAKKYKDPLDDPNLYSHGQKKAREGSCNRGCCWTPFNACWYRRRCNCHHPVTEAVIRDTIDEDGNVVEDFEALAAAA